MIAFTAVTTVFGWGGLIINEVKCPFFTPEQLYVEPLVLRFKNSNFNKRLLWSRCSLRMSPPASHTWYRIQVKGCMCYPPEYK